MKKQIVVLALCVLMLSLCSIAVDQVTAQNSDSSSENIAPTAAVTLFSESFEGAFPGTSWYVTDRTASPATSGYDYWGKTSYRKYSGSYSGWCAQMGTHINTVTIFTEGFEGTFPGTWTRSDSTGGGSYDFWGKTSYRKYSGLYSGWCAQVGYNSVYNEYNSVVHRYDNFMDAYMYKYVNLAGYSSATLTYRYWLDCEPYYDYFAAMYYDSIEGWINTNAKAGHYASYGWQYASINIPTSTHYVGFKFHSNYAGIYEGAYVDSISLTATTGQVYNYADHKYDTYMDAVMYRPVSLSGYSSVSLSYKYWLNCETNYDYLQVMYYSGGQWYYIDKHTGHYGYWQSSTLSIPTSATYVGFRFYSDYIVTYEGAYLDAIVCTGITTGLIFSNGFESGSFSAWTGTSATTGETKTVTSAVKHLGVYSARFTSNGGGGTEYAYCYKTLAPYSEVYARGYFGVSQSGIVQTTDNFYLIALRTATYTVAYAGWRINPATGLLRWCLVVKQGTASLVAYSASSPLLGYWYSVELRWRNGVSTGLGQLWINGVMVCSITGANTATYGNVNQVRFGLPFIYNCGSTTVYCDDVKVATSYIGP